MATAAQSETLLSAAITDASRQQAAYHASAQMLLTSLDGLRDEEEALAETLTQQRQDIERVLSSLHSSVPPESSTGELQGAVEQLVSKHMEDLVKLDLAMSQELEDMADYNQNALNRARAHLHSVSERPYSRHPAQELVLAAEAAFVAPCDAVLHDPARSHQAAVSTADSGSGARQQAEAHLAHCPSEQLSTRVASGSGPEHALDAVTHVVRLLAALPGGGKSIAELEAIVEEQAATRGALAVSRSQGMVHSGGPWGSQSSDMDC